MWKTIGAGLASWKTCIGATIAALIAVLQAVLYMIDADPQTVADWNQAVALILACVIAWNGLVARDADKSDQQSGIRPEPKK